MGFRRKRVEPADDYPGILNRQKARAVMEAKMGLGFEVLFLELKWGLGLFDRTARSTPDTLVADATLRLFWHYLEALDVVDALVTQGAVGPAQIHARTLFDVGLQLLYVLETAEDRVAAAYTAHTLRRKLADVEKFVVGSQKRKELEAEVKRTKHLRPDFLDAYPDTSAEVDEIRRILDESLWKEANAELERLGYPERWFRAFGGPTTIKDLARKLEMEVWHWAVYQRMSRSVHGGTPQRVFIPEAGKGLKIRPLRDCEDWELVVTTCHVLNVEVYWGVIDRFRNGERPAFGRWYVEEIRPILEASALKGQLTKWDFE